MPTTTGILIFALLLLCGATLGFDNTPPLDSDVTTKAVQALDTTTTTDQDDDDDNSQTEKQEDEEEEEKEADPLVSSGTLALIAIPSCVLLFAIISLAIVLSVVPRRTQNKLPTARPRRRMGPLPSPPPPPRSSSSPPSYRGNYRNMDKEK